MHRLFPFSSNSTTSGSGASTSSPEAQTSLSSSPPSKSSMPKPKQPPVDRRQSLDAYRPLAERLRSHLSVSSSAQGSDSTPAISSEGAASTITATSSTSSSSTSGGKLRRSTSASSLHSGGSKERSKYKLKNLWHRVSGSVTSIPGAFLGGTGGDGQSAKSSTSAGAERATPLGGGEATQEAAPGQPQLIYFMGSRPSTETSPPTAPTSSSTSTAPPPYSISTQEQEVNLKPQGRHAKLLSMVDEGAEDDVELVEYDRDESSSSEEEEDDSSDEEEGVRRSGETTAVNSPAGVPPSQRVLPPPGVAASGVAGLGAAAGSGTRTPTQRQTSRYVDPFAASPAIAPISVPPNSPEAPTAALPSTQATSMSFASFLGLTSSKPMFGFGSASATPTKQIDEGGEQPKVDPESLAQRIQELIDALPPPPIFNEIPQTPYPPTPYPPETPGDTYPGSPFPSRLPPPPKPRVPKRDSKTGRPIPPADAVPEGVDEDVVKLLWSVSVMGDQPLPEQGEGEGGEEGGEGEEKGDEETGKEPVEKGPVEEGEEKPTVPDTPKPNPDQRRRVPRTPVPRTPRSPRSPHRRHHPRTPGTRNIWQILEGYQTTGHIPATPYTGIGSGGTGAPGSVIPLPPVDEDESPDLGGGPIAGGDREEGGPVAGGDRERGGPIAGGDREGDTGGGGTNLFSDGGSIMLYSPLIPGLHDLVEMGEVVDILWEADEEDDEYLEDGVGVEYPGESEEGTTVVGSDSGLDTPKASDKGKGRGARRREGR
ncbi:hypothetical protein BKA70DRAFT_114297 [Coprinopsis sp. MPI-PUGE-AT-0042]|nr:hypothetical protein BKA70DRAFT_114297 [Coprinopsis sp. MPI-PUGE-AT-0042]